MVVRTATKQQKVILAKPSRMCLNENRIKSAPLKGDVHKKTQDPVYSLNVY